MRRNEIDRYSFYRSRNTQKVLVWLHLHADLCGIDVTNSDAQTQSDKDRVLSLNNCIVQVELVRIGQAGRGLYVCTCVGMVQGTIASCELKTKVWQSVDFCR